MRTNPRTTRAPRYGFSLAEMVIALAILGVGLSMLLSLFPAAIVETASSTNQTMGSLICQNGLTMAKSALTSDLLLSRKPSTDEQPHNGWMRVQEVREAWTNLVNLGDRRYPVQAIAKTTTRGVVILARKVNADVNDHRWQLIAVSYAKKNATGTTVRGLYPTDTPEAHPKSYITQDIDRNEKRFTVTGNRRLFFKKGGVVIDCSQGSSGEFARIAEIERLSESENRVTLDRAFSRDVSRVIVIEEYKGAALVTDGDSAVMNVMSIETILPKN